VTGARLSVEVDTIVFSGGWVPEYGLARSAGVVLDPGSGGPAVDALGRTSRIGWFAAGNLVHPVETADSTAVQAARVVPGWQRALRGHEVPRSGGPSSGRGTACVGVAEPRAARLDEWWRRHFAADRGVRCAAFRPLLTGRARARYLPHPPPHPEPVAAGGRCVAQRRQRRRRPRHCLASLKTPRAAPDVTLGGAVG